MFPATALASVFRTPTRTAGARVLLLGLLVTCVPVQAAEVYRWKDAQGVTHYSDSKPREQQAETVRVDTRVPDPGSSVATLYKPPEAPEQPAAWQQPSIVMYTSPTCSVCHRAERYFAANNLSYQSIDITASAQNRKKFEKAGGYGTPLIFVGRQRLYGFDKKRLNALIFGGQ